MFYKIINLSLALFLLLGIAAFLYFGPPLSSYLTLLDNNKKSILTPLSEDTSEAMIEAHLKDAENLAKEGDSINILACHASPIVLKVGQKNFPVTIKNLDNLNRRVVVDPFSFTLKPSQEQRVDVVDFKSGLHEVDCSSENADSLQIAGFIIIPKLNDH